MQKHGVSPVQMLNRSLMSNRNCPRARVDAQQPTDSKAFKSHFTSPSVAAGDTSGAATVVSTCCSMSNGKLRATPPTAPKTLPANRHTIRQQDRDDRPRQRVNTVRVSADSQSESPSSRQEPIRRVHAVPWSSLSHRNSKATSTGASTSPAQVACFLREARCELEGRRTQSVAERPSRKRPIEGPLWSCRTWDYSLFNILRICDHTLKGKT